MIHSVSAQNYTTTNISNPLIQTRTCEYHGVRNINFSENVMYVQNEWSKKEIDFDWNWLTLISGRTFFSYFV